MLPVAARAVLLGGHDVLHSARRRPPGRGMRTCMMMCVSHDNAEKWTCSIFISGEMCRNYIVISPECKQFLPDIIICTNKLLCAYLTQLVQIIWIQNPQMILARKSDRAALQDALRSHGNLRAGEEKTF